MACRVKDEYQRYYTVTEPRSHPKGHTEYKVTAKFVSKTKPEDVKEITIWKRYSDFKKLHGDLSYIHRNLFRRMEEFPAFPKAQVFGRFEPEVIEERRKAAEAMLRFTVHIPALNNSPQLKEFFRDGEIKRPLEACDLCILPPPLIPVPQEGTDIGTPLLPGLQWHLQAPGDPTPAAKSEEDLDLLFASVEEEKESGSPLHGPLSVQDLAFFDPFVKEEQCSTSPFQGATLAVGSELLPSQDIELAADALWDLQISQPAEQEAIQGLDPGGYLAVATEEITLALKREAARDYAAEHRGEIMGPSVPFSSPCPGDPDPTRREAVKKKTAEYLHRAEELVQLHLTHLQP
uniref:Sorting nexin-15 n=1 Tax=Pelodiscus sinensis TaxID=13735 RepID=K7GAD0_PELSI